MRPYRERPWQSNGLDRYNGLDVRILKHGNQKEMEVLRTDAQQKLRVDSSTGPKTNVVEFRASGRPGSGQQSSEPEKPIFMYTNSYDRVWSVDPTGRSKMIDQNARAK